MLARRIWAGLKFCALVALAAGIAALLGGPDLAGGAFPGANGKIAFVSDRDGSTEIYVMNADGSGQQRLTNSASFSFSAPVWSPDGSRIAFVGNDDIYLMNGDGSCITKLTSGGIDDSPAWSPDGSKIAFERSSEIYVVNADGSGQQQLTTGHPDQDPAWSPDGSLIAFARLLDFFHSEIYLMNAGGGGEVELTDDGIVNAQPAWSPDGSKLAYTRTGVFVPLDIFVMNADGTGQTARTTTGDNSSPAWSPDGSKIVFDSFRDADSEIYVMNSDGSGKTRLTTAAGDDTEPDWQPLGGPAPDLGPQSCIGGVAELPDVAGTALEADRASGPNPSVLAGIAVAAAAGALALGGSAWWARRRFC